MAHLLHLDSSARRDAHSRRLGRIYAESWRAAHPDGEYTYRDLAADPVPPITEGWTELCDHALRHQITDPRRLADAAHTGARRAAWDVLLPLVEELYRADVLLIGTPMYNYSVPAALKAWIDQVTFPRARLSARVVITASRGGAYGPGTPRAAVEHQVRYLQDFFAGHFDVGDVECIAVEYGNSLVDPTLDWARPHYDDSYTEALREAEHRAAEAAR